MFLWIEKLYEIRNFIKQLGNFRLGLHLIDLMKLRVKKLTIYVHKSNDFTDFNKAET